MWPAPCCRRCGKTARAITTGPLRLTSRMRSKVSAGVSSHGRGGPPARCEPGCRGARSQTRRQVGHGEAGTGFDGSKPQRGALAPPLLVEQQVLDDLADQMDGQDVHLLNSLGVAGWDDQAPVGKLAKGPAVPAEDREGVNAEAGGLAERPEQVLRAPAGADPHEE